ncbi:probable cytochrome P450 6a14 [Anopheles coustani]|uniref:probable cytochrome P450 6a14 n=1 Tax=Anopheles coustani TaxID=139045 RepID=UPI00265B3D07|nr:probable cytochrome P450 6a14 [Anopheles coustani]
MALLGVVLLGIVLVLSLAYLFLRDKHRFWLKRNFPCKPNPSLLVGHMEGNGSTRHAAYVTQEVYHYVKGRGERFIGISYFFMPLVIVCDLELVKTILVQDFSVFHDRGMYSNVRADPLSGHLFNLEGHEWRTLRQKLTPTFTSGRMKQMFGLMLSVAEELRSVITDGCATVTTGLYEQEMKGILARFTTDVIGTCAFGIECNTLRDAESDFLKYGNRIFQHKLSAMVKILFAMLFRGWAKKLGVKATEDDVEAFFMNLVRETVEYREKHNVQRNDFLNLLIHIKNKGSLVEHGEGDALGKGEVGMTQDELAAQVFIFFVAGFETSSTVMNFCLYELAMNPDIQERLRDEINIAMEKAGGTLSYDVAMSIPYLDQVINETLRKYPPLESTNRMAVQDYTIPGTTHVIPRNVLVQIPIYAIHHDPEYYHDPDRFDPERFSALESKNRPPCVFLPFGDGPRQCIGMRFGLMQVKVGLLTLLQHFYFRPSEKTPQQIVFDPKTFILSPVGGNHLQIGLVGDDRKSQKE